MRFLGGTYTFTRPQVLQSSTGTHLLHTCYTPVTHLLLSTDILVYQDHFLSAERLSNFPFLLLHPLLLFVSARGKLLHEK